MAFLLPGRHAARIRRQAADLLVRAYGRCYGLPVLVVRPNNVYGPGQNAEKLVPSVISRLRGGECACVEGDGLQRRSFLFLQDAAAAIDTVRLHGKVGEAYNVAADSEHTVLEVVQLLSDALCPRPSREVVHVPDRPYNDRRYWVTDAKLRKLGWAPKVKLAEGLQRCIQETSA